MRASKVDDVYDCFAGNPIAIEDLDEYYVDVDKGRGLTPLKKMRRLFEKNPGGSYHFLFAGYKGCGKSTELIRLQRDLQKDFIILNFSVREELDILNISYIELFIALMKRLFGFVNENPGVTIHQKYIDDIANWVRSKEIEGINDKYLGMGLEAGAGATSGIPFLANFFAKFTASAKASSSLKETLKITIEPKLSELILNCNILMNEIKSQLHTIDKKGLIIIVEDIPVDDYYKVLAECAADKKKKPNESKELLDLRNNLTVLSYNGENWSDVHPVVLDILRERGKI